MSDTVAARRFVVHGRVQGVGFRYFVQEAAAGMEVTGFVRNVPDGTVEVLAEGPPKELDRLARALDRGPALSMVTRVEVSDQPVTNRYERFAITFY